MRPTPTTPECIEATIGQASDLSGPGKKPDLAPEKRIPC
jgi:hypothetical protein